MPNWCDNIVIAAPEVLGLLKNSEGHADFEALLPTPTDEEALREAYENRLTKIFEVTELMVTPFKLDEGRYWWHVLNWGTKWNIDDEKIEIDDNTRMVHFETAWSPAVQIAAELSRRSPGFEVTIEYCELGNYFAGWDMYINGTQSANVEVDLNSWEGVKWVRERFFTDFYFCEVCNEDLYPDGNYIQHEH